LIDTINNSGKTVTPEEIETIEQEHETHKNGKVLFDEFKMMLGTP